MTRQRIPAASRRALALASLLLIFNLDFMPKAFAAMPAPAGRWIWDTGAAALEFHACGTALCGRIIWLREQDQTGAKPVLDVQNPDTSLRARPICGLDYITGLRQSQAGAWVDGRIYDFVHGGSYDLDITLVKPDHIAMRGYQGIPLLGATLHLLPAPVDLKTCVPGEANVATGQRQ